MTGHRTVEIANHHPGLRLDRRAVARAIHTLDAHAAEIVSGRTTRGPQRVPDGELSLVFLTDAALARLHGDFLDDPSTTDVITFEGAPEAGSAGEICVSADTAAAYAREHRRDFSAELTLYLVHGWLHLAGHDDLVPAKKRAMRRAEKRAMSVLQAGRAIPRFRLDARAKRRPVQQGGGSARPLHPQG
jgi:probable rRNA maturation factor